jgi:hypothetical protein
MPTPLPVIPNTFRCALKWATPSGTAVNVIHILAGDGTSTPTSIFEALDDAVTVGMWAPVFGSCSITGVDVTPLDGVSATTSFSTGAPAKWSGSSGGEALVAPAAIIKLTTAVRGRNRRGRIFLPGISSNAFQNGFIVDGSDVTATIAWNTFQNTLAADAPAGFAVVVASYDRRHGGVGAHAQIVTTFLCEPAAGTQRRRQGRLR